MKRIVPPLWAKDLVEFPFLRAAGQINSVKVMIVAPEENRAARHYWRRENLSAAMKLPFYFVERRRALGAEYASVRGVAAKARCVLCEHGRTQEKQGKCKQAVHWAGLRGGIDGRTENRF